MRRIFLFIVSMAIIIFVLYFSLQNNNENKQDIIENEAVENEYNEQVVIVEEAEEENETLQFDYEGIIAWMGKSEQEIIEYYGEPSRRDLSPYNYEWLIYHDEDYYIQIAIKDYTVVSLFTNDENADIGKIKIGDSYETVQGHFQFDRTIPLRLGASTYQFELNDEELSMRPLIKYGNIWMQLYFDVVSDELSSVRIIDGETLLLQRPYSLMYRGELPEIANISDENWQEIQEGSALQIFDLTNMIRKKHGLSPLQWDEKTAAVAYAHSKDMYENNYFSHTSPDNGELQDRLEDEQIVFQYAGENIAAKYVDSIAAVEGWLNSEGHRVNLLNEQFTHIGIGVYRDYYTQNFVTPW